jgi:hypothetical protein
MQVFGPKCNEGWGTLTLLSVVRTCVTKQTKDLRYIGRGSLWFLDFGLAHDDAVCPGK